MRSKWVDLPLKTRLTVLYVVFLLSLLGTLGTILYSDTKHFLLVSTALRLRAQAKPVIERWFVTGFQPPPPVLPPQPEPPNQKDTPPAPAEELTLEAASSLSRALTSRDTTAIVIDAHGDLLACGRVLPEEPLPVPPDPDRVARALAGDKEITYTTSNRGERELVVLIPLRRTPADPRILGVVQLNTPLALIDKVLWRQRLLIGIGILVTLVVGAAGGTWIAGRVLSPLKRMVSTCRSIASGDLSQRVALPRRRDEVGQLASAFDEMVNRLERMFSSQKRFVVAAAHELRTPLAAIRGSLEVLLRGGLDDRETSVRLIQGAYRETTRLGRLAERLLDLTRLNTPVLLHRREVDLSEMISEVAQEVRMMASGREIRVAAGQQIIVKADPDYLKQVLYDLLDNAIRHTDEEGNIEIGWRFDPPYVVIWVEDDGEGIDPRDLPHIFEPFYQGRSQEGRRGGAGLGLALVKAVVEAHGGTITVRSTPGSGTQFVIQLPHSPTGGASSRPTLPT